MAPQLIIIQSSKCYNSSFIWSYRNMEKMMVRLRGGVDKESYTEMVTIDLDFEGLNSCQTNF